MQIVLQATHGVVSGEPEFFKHAFGDTQGEFERILALPHDYIFNRDWYERGDGRPELEDFAYEFGQLSTTDQAELLMLLSSCDPRDFKHLPERADSSAVRKILAFYEPKSKDELRRIWAQQRLRPPVELDLGLAEDERVEDAGLDAEEPALEPRNLMDA
jgi:hypothetical protein